MSLILSGTDGLSDVDGSAATPAIRGTDANTGIFFPAADTIAFAEGGAEVIRIDSSGNLGIGTSSPARKLNVAVAYSSGTIVPSIKIATVGGYDIGSGTGIDFGQDQGTYSTWVTGRIASPRTGDNWGGSLTFLTNDNSAEAALVERMRIDSSGNLGIGTTTGSARFTANLDNSTAYANTAPNAANCTAAFTNGSAHTSGGTFVGYQLNISGNSQNRIGYFGAVSESTSNQGLSLVFGTNTTAGDRSEKMRLTSSGDLYVGTTTGTIGTGNFGASISQAGGIFASRNEDGSVVVFYTGGNAGAFRVLGSGNAQNTNNSYGAISDVKLKENIVDASPKLADLMQVKVRNYNLIGDTTKQIGVVAQELETVFPAMIDATFDKDAEGNDLGTTTKSVKYSVFVPMLIKAIQEQQALITQLTARITALEGT